MKTLFYPKLAVNGMKKNKRLYLPYILTLVAMVMMMYITAYLARSENIANTNRGVYAQWCLWLGIIVIGIFSLIFLFYSYFVLIKNRGKEFGLYNYSRNEQTQHCTHTPLRKPFHAYHITSLRTCRRDTPVTSCGAVYVQTSRH